MPDQGLPPWLGDLKQRCRSLATANAHGTYNIPCTATLALDQRVANHPGTRHAVGVAYRDGTAIHVDAFIRYSERVTTIENLDCKCLIQFPEVNIVHFQASALQKFWHGKYRANPHFIRFATGYRRSAVNAQWAETPFFGYSGFHNNCRGCSVGQLTGIPGRNESTFSHWFQTGKALQRCRRAIAFVLVKDHVVK